MGAQGRTVNVTPGAVDSNVHQVSAVRSGDQIDVTPLARADIHVWLADLTVVLRSAGDTTTWLPPTELDRSDRFTRDADRQRYIARRIVLRTILARQLGLAPKHLCFVHNRYGKPELAPQFDESRLCFNVSSSQDVAAVAVAHARAVGVDVECIRPLADAEDVAARFFSREEADVLLAAAAAARSRIFFEYWTRKEAVIKATGEGLSRPLDSFVVPLEGTVVRLGEQATPAVWSVRTLETPAGFAGAVAAAGEGWRMRCRQWTADNLQQPGTGIR